MDTTKNEYHARVRGLLDRMKLEGETYHCEQITKIQAETGSTVQEMLEAMEALGMHGDAAAYRRHVVGDGAATTDIAPRLRAAASVYGAMIIGHEGYERANPETRAALEADSAAILEAADHADSLRDRRALIVRMAMGISHSHATGTPILGIEEEGGMVSIRLPDLADAILDSEA